MPNYSTAAKTEYWFEGSAAGLGEKPGEGGTVRRIDTELYSLRRNNRNTGSPERQLRMNSSVVRDGRQQTWQPGSSVRPVNEPRGIQTRPQHTARRQSENARTSVHSEIQQRRSAVRMDLPSMLLLTVAVAIALVMGYQYLCATAAVNRHAVVVRKLEQSLDTLRTENEELKQSIDTSMDMNLVYRMAVEELGMTPQSPENTINYRKTDCEYVRQYEAITE